MTYRQPAFMVNNYGAGSISDITQIVGHNAGGLNNEDKRAFFDGRVSSIGSYVSTSTSATTVGVYTIADGNTIDLQLATTVSERYWIIQQNSISVGNVTTARGFWLGTYSQLSGSAHVDPAFELGWKAQLVDTDYPGGVAVAQISPPRRTFSLRVRDIDPASSDYSILDGVMQSREKPFWYWPPDDTDPGPFYVRHSNEPKRVQDFGAPTQALRYTFDFDLIEDNL